VKINLGRINWLFGTATRQIDHRLNFRRIRTAKPGRNYLLFNKPSPIRTIPSAPALHRILLAVASSRAWWTVTIDQAHLTVDRELPRQNEAHPAPKVSNIRDDYKYPGRNVKMKQVKMGQAKSITSTSVNIDETTPLC
jgi:hypothetical protein